MNGRVALSLLALSALVAFMPARSGSGLAAAATLLPEQTVATTTDRFSLSCSPTSLPARPKGTVSSFTCRVSGSSIRVPANFWFKCAPDDPRVRLGCRFDWEIDQPRGVGCWTREVAFPVAVSIRVERAPSELKTLRFRVVGNFRECEAADVEFPSVAMTIMESCERAKPPAKKAAKKKRQDAHRKAPSAKTAWARALDPAAVDRKRLGTPPVESAADDAFAKAPQLAGELAGAAAWRTFSSLAKDLVKGVIGIAAGIGPGLAGHEATGVLVGKIIDVVATAGVEAAFQQDVKEGIKEGVRKSLRLAVSEAFKRHVDIPGDRLGKAVDDWVAAATAENPCLDKSLDEASKKLVNSLTATLDGEVYVDKLLSQGTVIQISYAGTTDEGHAYRVRASFIHDEVAGKSSSQYLGANRIDLSDGEAGYATWWFTVRGKRARIVAYGRPAFTKDPGGFAELEEAYPIGK